MEKRKISVAVDPDSYSTGHSIKRALSILFVGIGICWIAMELCKIVSITFPLYLLFLIHIFAFIGLVAIYRWLQLRGMKEDLI